MPVTKTEYPILGHFLDAVEKRTGMPAQTADQDALAPSQHHSGSASGSAAPKKLPPGVILDEDGKPCRSCNSFAALKAMAKSQNRSASVKSDVSTPTYEAAVLPEGCPPDVEVLGRSTWNMLHTMTANYPVRPTSAQQQQTKSFLSLFSNLYPCSHCAEDFRDWMKADGNTPRLNSRDEFGRWMCEAHNAVNVKLGKSEFDCAKWEERWATGPADGRCG